MSGLPRSLRTALTVVLAAAALSSTGCTKVAGTGRAQLNFMSLEQDASLGDEAYAETLAGKKLIKDGPDAERVRRIGMNIADAARRLGVDLIIVGHRRAKGWAERWWRGSLGATLMDTAPCSVLISLNPPSKST